MREDEQPIMLHNQRLLSNSQESAKVNIEQSSGVDLNSKSDSKTPKVLMYAYSLESTEKTTK